MAGNPSRFEIAGLVSLVAAAASGLGLVGWFGGPWAPWLCLTLALAGGLASGLIEGRDLDERLSKAAGFILGAVAVTLATAWYAEGRSELYSLELLIPMGIGGAIFAGARLGLKALARSGQARILRAVSLVLILGAPAGALGLVAKPIQQLQEQAEARRPLSLELTADAEGRFFFQGKEVPKEKLEAFLCAAAKRPQLREVRMLHPEGMDSRKLAAKILIPAARCGLSAVFVPRKAATKE